MAYADLTDEEKADLNTFFTTVGPLLRNFAKLMKEIDPESLDTWITAVIEPILLQLQNTDIIPNSTTYASSSDMEMQEVNAIKLVIRDLRLLRTNNRTELVKLIGINA